MVVFRMDGCGHCCLLLTYISIAYTDYVVVKILIVPVLDGSLAGAFIVVSFNILVSLMVISHLRAVFSDPGIVPVPNVPVDLSDQDLNEARTANGWTLCTKCESYRPPRAHHCRVCKRCIRRMDHHCPWINNCVGEWNQKYFIQFLIYVGLTSICSVTLIFVSWILDPVSAHMRSQEAKVLHSILLAVVSLLYGLFVVAIMSDQFGAICNDESPIDALQHRRSRQHLGQQREKRSSTPPPRSRKSAMASLRMVFGGGPVLFWLLPCDIGPKKRAVDYDSGGYDV